MSANFSKSLTLTAVLFSGFLIGDENYEHTFKTEDGKITVKNSTEANKLTIETKDGETTETKTISGYINIKNSTRDHGLLSLEAAEVKFDDIGLSAGSIKELSFDSTSGTKLIGRASSLNDVVHAKKITGSQTSGTNEIKGKEIIGEELNFKGGSLTLQAHNGVRLNIINLQDTIFKTSDKGAREKTDISVTTSITMNKGNFTANTLNIGQAARSGTSRISGKIDLNEVSLFKTTSIDGADISIELKKGSKLETGTLKNIRELTTTGGSTQKPNSLKVTNSSERLSISTITLDPHSSIEAANNLTSDVNTTFNFSTTDSSFNIGSITTTGKAPATSLQPELANEGDLSLLRVNINAMDTDSSKTHFEKFVKIIEGSESTSALLLKEKMLNTSARIRLNSSTVDGSYFDTKKYDAKTIDNTSKGKYKLGKNKLDSNFTFVDFYFGKKADKTEDSATKVLDLLARYNKNGLHDLITDTQGDDPSTAEAGSSSSGSSEGSGSIDPTLTHKPSPTPPSGVSGNAQRLALSIGDFGSRFKSSLDSNSESAKVFSHFFMLDGDKATRKENALNQLGDLLPSDLDNSLQNFALETYNTTASTVDSIVQDSSLANSLKSLSKLRFASNDASSFMSNGSNLASDIKSDIDINPRDGTPQIIEYIEESVSEAYAQVFYQNIYQKDISNIKGYSSNSFGLVAGYNHRVLDLILGVNLGYASSIVSKGTNFNTLAPRFYLYSLDEGFSYQASIGYAMHIIGSERVQSFLGSKASASYLANEFNASFLLGYKMNFDKHLLTPAFKLTYLLLSQNPYEEKGSFGLKVDSKTQQALLPSVGLNYSYTLTDGLKLSAGAFVFYDVLSKTPLVNASFLDGEISFLVASLGNESFGGSINTSLSYELNERHALSLTYLGSFKASLVASALSARYGFRF
ncbi:hypothetical protein BKH43_07745 [Helicobacter sp. 13S00401-1]|uniref:autotransporter outer membrane beta-barrel domain-containing protein n=1 Tax=Helicobacter sp. 13S00401-1 TaxID=1905758 RepID=UPI000BA60783|nr:autotransporter outer membrane beta-barrel domain-containing protein [Helicobacter sp. 13S00401-1]PAF48787.1 hypothetical protein BKH43_07745 [Helicobacter sp. 13S00401-1]